MKQTAVEWLVDKVTDMIHESNHIELVSLLEQAKQMEKEQIVEAVDVGFEEGSKFPEDIKLNNAEQYYDQTYKQPKP